MWQLHHDTLVARHREKWKTTKLVMRNYWWPEVMRNIEQYMEGYNMCQRIKNRIEIPVGELKLSEVISISLYLSYLDNLSDVSIGVYSHLVPIISCLYHNYSTWLVWTVEILIIATIFRRSYSVLLGSFWRYKLC